MNLLLVLVPLAWLGAATAVVAICRAASIGDARLLADGSQYAPIVVLDDGAVITPSRQMSTGRGRVTPAPSAS
jgi:hypothetical protein